MFNAVSNVFCNPTKYLKDNLEIIPYIKETNRQFEDLKIRVRNIAQILNTSENFDSSYNYLKETTRSYNKLIKRIKYINKFYENCENISTLIKPILMIRGVLWSISYLGQKYIDFLVSNNYGTLRAPITYPSDYLSQSTDWILLGVQGSYLVNYSAYKFLWKKSNDDFLKDKFFYHFSLLFTNKELIKEKKWIETKRLLTEKYLKVTEYDPEKLPYEFHRALDKLRSQMLDL